MVKKKKHKITFKKPPDKYNCIKLPFRNIIIDETNKNKIMDCIIRTNKITIKTYQLLRLWILNKYRKKKDIPTITKNTIKMVQKSILEKSAGPKPKGDNLELFNEFKEFHSFTLENGVNLSQILGYNAISIITAIENNIKMHYFDYIRRFINSYFKHKYEEEMKNKDFKQQLFKDLKKLKNDIINNTTTCDIKYHKWLNKNRNNIIPKEVHKNGYYYDIQIKPQKYLKYMIWMNIQLEKIDAKMFQFMPLRTDIIPKNIPLDTKSLIEIFVEKDKNKYLCDIENTKDELWSKYFNIDIKMTNYIFDYTIITDGYSASIRFIHKDKLQEETNKKEKMKNAKQDYKGLNKEEKEALKKKKKEEQKKLNKLKPKIKKEKIDYIEFPYIDEVDKMVLEGKRVFIDPGKRDLLSIIDDEGNRFTYSNKQRVKETKRLKYQRLIKNLKDELGICEIENTLSAYNSKTCNLTKFKKYIKEKNKVNDKLFKLYENEKFRQYKWYAFINKKRTEDNMLNLIENKFGKDLIVIHGNWSIKKQMRNFISTPNLGIKRKLKERFKVFNIDEFRTSCLYHKTEEKGENLYLPDHKNKLRKLHSVLTFKMENTRKGCINRDYNGCINIRKLFNSYINNKPRPQRYCRGYEIKTANPCKKVSNGGRLERKKGIFSESAFIKNLCS
tara:strand:- start:4428 stop:6437 length:2010 start_codon:yes stop_codon:yes gene_type:complete